jgi:hypothetical protein
MVIIDDSRPVTKSLRGKRSDVSQKPVKSKSILLHVRYGAQNRIDFLGQPSESPLVPLAYSNSPSS